MFDKQKITEVKFSPVGDQLAVISHAQKIVNFVLTNPHSKFQVLGYVQLPYETYAISWNTSSKQAVGKDYPQLFVLVGFAIFGITPP